MKHDMSINLSTGAKKNPEKNSTVKMCMNMYKQYK